MKAIFMVDVQINFDNSKIVSLLLGIHEVNLKQLAEEAGVQAYSRGDQVTITGPRKSVLLARLALTQLYELVCEGYFICKTDVTLALHTLSLDPKVRLKDIYQDQLSIIGKKKTIRPKTLTQKVYLDAIRSYDIVFGVGPAGTGKTYLAMAMAVDRFLQEKVSRIVLVRPAVEAGEKLGFLPGDLADKVSPYLRPLYDALYDIMGFEKASRLMNKGVIEIAPLAFMRGRTLNASFVILDEAQNTTNEQMKMFLTRLGLDSWAVITGDVTQVDLPIGTSSGLIEARRILAGIKGIAVVDFTETDVVRHRLVREIIRAYKHDELSNIN